MEIQVGERIRELRTEKGLSQADLARKLEVSPVTVYRWETGTREISLTMLGKVADKQDTELSEFFPKSQAPLFPPEGGQRRGEDDYEAPSRSPETAGTGLLSKAKDAVRRDSRRESQAIQRAHASEGPQTVSGYEEDQLRAELRSLDFEHIFEKVLWPAVQEAVEADQLREEVARLSEEVARLSEEAEDYASRD
jgi:transcriptional regulator with XRE-family HTH domain